MSRYNSDGHRRAGVVDTQWGMQERGGHGTAAGHGEYAPSAEELALRAEGERLSPDAFDRARLTERERQVLVAIYADGVGKHELARRLGVAYSTVQVTARRGLEKLRRFK